MLRIISFLIYNLKKNSFIEFLHTFIEKAETCPTVLAALASWFNVLKAKFAEAQRIHFITNKSPITELMSLSDRQRDGILTGLKALVRSYEKSIISAECEAARTLMVGLSSIKLNVNDRYQEQTGQVDNLLHFLTEQESEAVETLHLTAVVAQLKVVNDRMHEFIEGRVSEIISKEAGAFEKARNEAEEAYRQFVLSANSWSMLNADRVNEGASEDGSTLSMAEFITWANAYIEYTDRTALKQPADKVEEEVEDAEKPEQEPENPEPENPTPENPAPENPAPENPEGSEGSEDSENSGNQGSGTGGGNTNPGGGYVPPSNGGGFD